MSRTVTGAGSLHVVARCLGISATSQSLRSVAWVPSFLSRRLFASSLARQLGSQAQVAALPIRPLGRRAIVLSASRLETDSTASLAATEMGQTKCEAPYGSWKSPLTAEFVSGASKRLGGAAIDSDGRLLWLEGRPSEAGRSVLVRQGEEPGSNPEDITPAGFNVRTLVHEYGGGAFTVKGDVVVFSNYDDQRLYKQSISGDCTPVPLTPDYGNRTVRYADGEFDARFNRLIIVREDNRQEGVESVNEIVGVGFNNDANIEPKVLVKGSDFYMSPRLSPDGHLLAWMEWSHPNMPWDRTSIWVGKVSEDGGVTNPICVAGGDIDVVEAPTEPRWSPQGDLIFVSDRGSGYWNLYSWNAGEKKVKSLYPMEAEFTRPAWVFGISSYSFLGDSGTRIVCTYRQRGSSHLATLDLSSSSLLPIRTNFTDIYNVFARGHDVYISAGSPIDSISLVKVGLAEGKDGACEPLALWSSLGIDTTSYRPYFSSPTVVEFPTHVQGQTAYANFYPPVNGDYVGASGERPPLLLRSHGGPTAEASTALDPAIQYWTSRGWAFADVNYGGSTGYGRAFRERLYGQWGIVDVNDCCSCAEYLVSIQEVDSKRLCIDGRSAGGYTTIAALVFKETFTAGASLYGIGDLTILETETHKFESRYMTNLIGSKDKSKILYDRSPINFLGKLSCPIILFQGLEDKVVPPNQARMIYDAVKTKGIPVALVEYEGEQHGFRKAENIRNTLEQEMMFFARLTGGFRVADDITPIKVDNFDK